MKRVSSITGAAMVVAAVVLSGCGSLAAPSPAPSGPVSPTPSSELLETSSWTTFVSERYGFSIAHPADWTEDPGDHDWTFENDIEAWDSSATESFYTPGVGDDGGVRVSAWSAPVVPGMTVGEWISAYCTGQKAGPCTGILDGVADVQTRDQHDGLLSQFGDTMAFFVDGKSVYVVAVWRAETDPSVQPYGGARRLLSSFVSTMTLQGPSESPSAS